MLLFITRLSFISAADVNDTTNTENSISSTMGDDGITDNVIKENVLNTTQKAIKKVDDNKRITKTEQTESVDNYDALLEKVNEIKTKDSTEEYTIELQESYYSIGNPITWGATNGIKKLTINGNGQKLNGQQNLNFATVSEGYTLILKNLTISNCKTPEGSVVYNHGTLIIEDSIIQNNKAN